MRNWWEPCLYLYNIICIISTHLCCDGAQAIFDTLVQAASLLLLLDFGGLLSLLHEPLVNDPGHAVVPVERGGGRPRWNAFQVPRATFSFLP